MCIYIYIYTHNIEHTCLINNNQLTSVINQRPSFLAADQWTDTFSVSLHIFNVGHVLEQLFSCKACRRIELVPGSRRSWPLRELYQYVVCMLNRTITICLLLSLLLSLSLSLLLSVFISVLDSAFLSVLLS